MSKVSVIIPAAGEAKRFGPGERKIFRPLAGEPVLLRTLRAFAGRDDVCQMLLVVVEADAAELKRRFDAELAKMDVELVAGGATRTESVRNALARVRRQAELVCVHDAVRPCVRPAWIDAVFAAAEKSGAAILACPVHATLKAVSAGGVIEQTVARAGLWEAQTPQVFRRKWLQAAYAAAKAAATDDSALVEAAGHTVTAVMGDPRNIKITTPADLATAEAVIAAMEDK
ncbi:MAG: 2-C-methyl-D-erythritol 4-phosphate cytidylyltransferase [Planctomycetota bacterium]|jgi:2-C-methyl-D-erythritol 4-phosphate cytidylyltransferase